MTKGTAESKNELTFILLGKSLPSGQLFSGSDPNTKGHYSDNCAPRRRNSMAGRKRPSKFVFGGHLFLPKGTGTSRILSNSLPCNLGLLLYISGFIGHNPI